MSDSILESTKKNLGIATDYDVFDEDVIMHINSVFSTLHQLGIGPGLGFQITGDDEVWADFIGDDLRLNQVKSYVYLRVRLLFDPPTSSYLMEAQKEQVKEMEWRLNIHREEQMWPLTSDDDEVILDGGGND